jgi:hypothetical protein
MKPSKKILAAVAALLIVIVAVFVILKPKHDSPASAITSIAPTGSDTIVIDKMISNDAKQTNQPAKTTKLQVQQVSQKLPAERFNPTKYLVKNIKTRKNIVGKTVIEGTIANTSPSMVFKDIAIDVTYRSKTDASISIQRFIVYEVVQPGKKVPFKFKAKSPEGTKSFSTELVNAVVVR